MAKKKTDTPTPMMTQYLEAKKAYPDTILLFRMGDFYEMFHDDARLAARVLNLALTSRDKGEDPVPMAGFPYHQLDSYVGKLITAGYRAAVCEQVEDPSEAKGLVRREVTRVVTPGTLTEDILLDPRESNYLAAVVGSDPVGIAWVEISTGTFYAAGFPRERLHDELARISPAECLVMEKEEPFPRWLEEKMMITHRPVWAFGITQARRELTDHFKTLSMEGFGFQDDSAEDTQALRAAGAILDYLKETQKGSLEYLDTLIPYRSGDTLKIDEASRRSLEITRSLRDGRREGTLLAVLDKTVTPMGSRMMAEWITNPLTNPRLIELRQDVVEEFKGNPSLAQDLQNVLRGIYDLERLYSRVSTGRATPRDLKCVSQTLLKIPHLKEILSRAGSALALRLLSEIDECPQLCDILNKALADEVPLSARDGGVIRSGFHDELDQLRDMASGSRQWIAQYQAAQQEITGISGLKVGYNKVFGFYIEITHVQQEKVTIPGNYVRKQTIKNAERYITSELKEYEEKVLSAEERATELEYQLFVQLREKALAHRRRMQSTAHALAQLDVLLSFALLARQRNYVRPSLTELPILEIINGRHPVLDILTPDGSFVPNDTFMNDEKGHILLITGPNMAGKSTYIRQVALLTLMAQLGSFIPAEKATLGVVDQIFARVGASDELSRGQSTFMVEMTETARILNTATPQSLIVLDEIGRGTSTYDGISLAWAVVEYLHEKVRARTLFATHYHELTDLESSTDGVHNLNVAVREWEDEVAFLHKIIEGAANKSYGIHVARLAGIPRDVINRARSIMNVLENEHVDETGKAKIASASKKTSGKVIQGNIQMTLFGPRDHPVVTEVREVNLNEITPIQAIQMIQKWQDYLNDEDKRKK